MGLLVNGMSSTASTGPAGAHFEGQVGAFYLLTLLSGTEIRGLPGVSINSVEFQRAAEGHPLDDVIVKGVAANGSTRVLEIQVKRSISFSPKDPIFKDVVAQMLQADIGHELAVATARTTSKKVDSAYQDVLRMARHIGDPDTFMERIYRPGSANADMREFVDTFKANVVDHGGSDDNRSIWQLLRRFQILIFDYTALGSHCQALDLERAGRLLTPDSESNSASLMANLAEHEMTLAADGGDCDRTSLVELLQNRGFRFAGQRRYFPTRMAIAEASHQALADINDQVCNVTLHRNDYIDSINDALEQHRYVEIRGDGGVGKSGILKHLAQSQSVESTILVLRSGRTIPGGWTALRGVLGFDGSLRELLCDIAGSGGGILFIDNLDYFEDPEKTTVNDIVREIANIPGFSIVASARRDFAKDEPSWLPSSEIKMLGGASLIEVTELADNEIGDIAQTIPQLAPFFNEKHPAHKVARNLYRLSRLAGSGLEVSEMPTTETQMAKRWWQSADGSRDEGHRDRFRTLRALASQVLSGATVLDTSEQPAASVNALIKSEALKDLGNDQAVFSHDVLGEWAIGNLLHGDTNHIEQLQLEQPAGPMLARGMELLARFELEENDTDQSWQALLNQVSQPGHHASWRRKVLLAAVKSESSAELLDKQKNYFLQDDAKVLCEIIRLITATDVMPAEPIFTEMGLDPGVIPDGMFIPSEQSWQRLLTWLLSNQAAIPANAIPTVAKFFISWALSSFGQGTLIPYILHSLYQWLTTIEQNRREPFGSEFREHQRLADLELELRQVFLAFCDQVPTLARQYISRIPQDHRGSKIIRDVWKLSAGMSKAAPTELVTLTERALIPSQEEREKSTARYPKPFTIYDHEFHPISPAQGPFFQLLMNAPEAGLNLIRKLVAVAIEFHSGGKACGDNQVTIRFPEGERSFPWLQTYGWAREHNTHTNVLPSALMALESWAHIRIESGENISVVISDVLGPPGTAAAFLMVAVDVVLSHYPKSLEAAIPFVACPQLLCMDRERLLHDEIGIPDLFGFKALEQEPVGAVNLKSLKERMSRQISLESLLHAFAFEDEALRVRVQHLLQAAVKQLPPCTNESNFRDPIFMALHALNQIDPNNWKTDDEYHQYMPTDEEKAIMAAQDELSLQQKNEIEIQHMIGLVLEEPSKSSEEMAAFAVEWAQRHNVDGIDDKDEEQRFLYQHIVAAAMIVMRDGSESQKIQYREWVYSVFGSIKSKTADSVLYIRSGLRYNIFAMAFVGVANSLTIYEHAARELLEMTAKNGAAAGHGLGASIDAIVAYDSRLILSILRCAFRASIRPFYRWNQEELERQEIESQKQQQLEAAIDHELAWLRGEGEEPAWPKFPINPVAIKPKIRIGGDDQEKQERLVRPDEYIDHQSNATWLAPTIDALCQAQPNAALTIVQTYQAWTANENGIDVDETDDVANFPAQWNNVYYTLLAKQLVLFNETEIEQYAVSQIVSLPEDSFFENVEIFLFATDLIYFNENGMPASTAIMLREKLTERLLKTRGWRRLKDSDKASVERRMASAVAAMLFCRHGFTTKTQCYLNLIGIDKLDDFIPTLKRIVTAGPSSFIALLTLSLMEVSPRQQHLQFILEVSNQWANTFPNSDSFWVEQQIGRRLCLWIKTVLDTPETINGLSNEEYSLIEQLISLLIGMGIAEANQLEAHIRSQKG